MLSFCIGYEDAKKLLEVFYSSPYKNVLPYIEIMHNMREINETSSFNTTLKEHLEKEAIKLSQVVPAGE